MRLDRAVSESTTLSRSEIKKLVSAGLITVNGCCERNGARQVDVALDSVLLSGEPLRLGRIYIMLNKPRGVVSASRDERQKTVIDLLPKELVRKGLFPAGRLDSDTEGFVLITDDGDFAHRILSPKGHVQKVYLAGISGELPKNAAELFGEGLTLSDGTPCKSAGLTVLGEENGLTKTRVVLTEGMYHQIKRMFLRLGCEVKTLCRESIGGLSLDRSLLLGESRIITKEELELIENG